jgi:hypothetical protein
MRRVLLYYIIEIMTTQRFHRRPLLRFAYFRDGKRETEQVMQRPASYVGPRVRQENATPLSESKLPSRMPPSSSHPCTKCHADPTSRLLTVSPGPTPSLTPRPYHQQTLPFPDISSFNAVIGTKLPVQTALRKSSFHRMDEESLLLMRLGMRAR